MSFDLMYKNVIDGLIKCHISSAPRGKEIYEQLNHTFMIANPLDRLILNPIRKISITNLIGELFFILGGHDTLDLILPFNKNMEKYSDDGTFLNGAYGPRLFRYFNFNQIFYIEDKLRKDKDSRQAIISIYFPTIDRVDTKDVPCTLTFQFLIRDEKLIMIVNMRSNDVILGLPYDLFNFTMIQEIMAKRLGMKLGTYYHNVGSMHLYKENLDWAKEIVDVSNLIDDDSNLFTMNDMSDVFVTDVSFKFFDKLVYSLKSMGSLDEIVAKHSDVKCMKAYEDVYSRSFIEVLFFTFMSKLKGGRNYFFRNYKEDQFKSLYKRFIK